MSLLTMPALIGPMLGPPLGGFITTYATWHWIFLINLPIGLLGIALVTRFVENVRADKVEPFDLVGLALVGLGVGGLAFGLTVTGISSLRADLGHRRCWSPAGRRRDPRLCASIRAHPGAR